MVKIYLDTSDLELMDIYASKVDGFTTNPSLMAKAGITTYKLFAKAVLKIAAGRPVSFEVLADDFIEMAAQARQISEWGENVWVKIPVTNTRGYSSIPLIESLEGKNINVTAVMTYDQMEELRPVLRQNHIISVFAGRIADTGRDPTHWVRQASLGSAQVLWASAREILNVSQAEESGADIITLSPELIDKLPLHGKNLSDYSRETVTMFYKNGKGITL